MTFSDKQLLLFKRVMDKNNASESDRALGENLGFSTRTVKRFMKNLRDQGFIHTETKRYRIGSNWIVKRKISLGAQNGNVVSKG